MKTVAVTGGAGFIGANLVRRLVDEGLRVVALDDFSTGLKGNIEKFAHRILNISLLDGELLKKELGDCEHIFHLGARGSVPRSLKDPVGTVQVNTIGTLNLLEVSRSTSAGFTFTSSSSVYGKNSSGQRDEKAWLSPISPYAASKLSGEALVQAYSESFGFTAITYRLFNVFGPLQRPDHEYAAVIPKWIYKALIGEQIEIFGDGLQSRDFTFVDTVVDVLIEGMKKGIRSDSPINLAFGNSISLNKVIVELRKFHPELRSKNLPTRKGDIAFSRNSSRLVHELFPGIASISFSEAFEKTYNWVRDSYAL